MWMRVELHELGKTGGVFKKAKRTSGKRSAVKEIKVGGKEGGEEGGKEGGRIKNLNVVPHEVVRQIMNVLYEFDVELDPCWVLRPLNDIKS